MVDDTHALAIYLNGKGNITFFFIIITGNQSYCSFVCVFYCGIYSINRCLFTDQGETAFIKKP